MAGRAGVKPVFGIAPAQHARDTRAAELARQREAAEHAALQALREEARLLPAGTCRTTRQIYDDASDP